MSIVELLPNISRDVVLLLGSIRCQLIIKVNEKLDYNTEVLVQVEGETYEVTAYELEGKTLTLHIDRLHKGNNILNLKICN